MRRLRQNLLLGLLLVIAFCATAAAQDPSEVGLDRDGKFKDAPSKTLQETIQKMRIEREKKDFDDMLDRGLELQKITDDLERSYQLNAKLTPAELVKLDSVEKLVKKIRTELGGQDEDGDDTDPDVMSPPEKPRPLSLGDAIKSLRDSTVKLYGELKKTTRFSVSVISIQTANAVLKLTRFLKITH